MNKTLLMHSSVLAAISKPMPSRSLWTPFGGVPVPGLPLDGIPVRTVDSMPSVIYPRWPFVEFEESDLEWLVPLGAARIPKNAVIEMNGPVVFGKCNP